jgi:hypothetical protein
VYPLKEAVMSPQDRKKLETLFAHGPASLLDKGTPPGDVAAFMARDDVRDALAALEAEYSAQDALLARQQFLYRRRLSRSAPLAVRTVVAAMRGNEYARDGNGNILLDHQGNYIVREAAPNKTQLDAARAVLQSVGLGEERVVGNEAGLKVVLQQQVNAPVQINYGDDTVTEAQRALSRERIRTALTVLAPKLLSMKSRLDRPTTRRRKVVSKAAKSTAGK